MSLSLADRALDAYSSEIPRDRDPKQRILASGLLQLSSAMSGAVNGTEQKLELTFDESPGSASFLGFDEEGLTFFEEPNGGRLGGYYFVNGLVFHVTASYEMGTDGPNQTTYDCKVVGAESDEISGRFVGFKEESANSFPELSTVLGDERKKEFSTVNYRGAAVIRRLIDRGKLPASVKTRLVRVGASPNFGR